MGLWGDVSEGLSTSLTGSKNTFNEHTNAPPGDYRDRRDTFTRRTSNNKGVADLINPIFGSVGEQAYKNYLPTINQGYQQLNQPLNEDPGGRSEVARAAAEGLASSFADRVYQKTGSLPTEDQLRQFVSQSLTPGFAAKFIQGMPVDALNSMADQYLQGNPDALTNPGTQSAEQQRIMGLKDQLDKIYGAGKENLVSGYDSTVYGPAKTRAVNDLAGQGMLTNPNSRYTLDAIDANRGRDLQSGLNTLESNRASGQVDLGKTIEDLLQRNADRSQNSYQFNKTFNANEENTAFNQGIQRKSLDMAGQIGKAQANGQKKDWMDYLNTGINAASTAAKIYAMA